MNKKRGYLLLEGVVYIGVLGIIMLILYSLIFLNLRYFSVISDKIEVQQQNYALVNYLENKLKLAKNVKSIKTKNYDFIQDDNFECEEVISIVYENSDSSVDEFYFDLYSTKKSFYRKDLKKPGYELSNYIENISVSKLNNGKLIKLKVKTKKGNQIYDSETFINLRNHEGR